MGESAEYYKDNRQESMKVFSYQKLLKAFGADENLEDEMLSDQGSVFSFAICWRCYSHFYVIVKIINLICNISEISIKSTKKI